MAEPRSRAQRKADTLVKLVTPALDAWVSTSGGDDPYLVPLSLAWHEERLILALGETSRTARNITATGAARIGLGPTRDVVMIDAIHEGTYLVAGAGTIADVYAAQSDWDPREEDPGYVYLLLRPVRIQAWREVNEIAGRLLMRDGVWLPSA